MRLFDSHCHVEGKDYDSDRDQMMDRARAAGICGVMVAGITEQSCGNAIALSERYPDWFLSVGVHPHDSQSLTEEGLARLAVLSRHAKVRAWGETGLDFVRMYSPKEVQERWFARQLATAQSLGLPVILHERGSGGRLLEILKANLPERRGVVHCFSGTREELYEYLDLGFMIGITGVVTQQARGEGLRELLPLIPEDRILVETDAPYLTPSPERNKHRRNEPAFVASVFRKVCEVLEKDPEALEPVIFSNTCGVFGINAGEVRGRG
ncbi:MAG: TatD family hydrolase [Thermodesulfobacteriota bacterium]